jgi:hypothetical protein
MAELRIDGNELVLHLTGDEKLEAVHGDFSVPLTAVRGIEVLDDAHEPADHGFKVGMRLPGVAEVATVRTHGKKLFAAVHQDTPRGLRVLLDGQRYDEWIIGCEDPEAVAAALPLPRLSET